MAFNQDEYNATNITTATTTQVFTGKGVLNSIVVNTTAAGTIILANGVAGNTTTFATLKASIAEGTYTYNCTCSRGLRITTAAASDITVNWSQA